MTFQFQCPYGHLLAAEESQAGQQCACPMCNTMFIVPAPLARAVAAGPTYPPAAPQFSPAPPAPPAPPVQPLPPAPPEAPPVFQRYEVRETPSAKPKLPPTPPITPPEPQPEPPAASVVPQESEVLHIPCPNGHLLETPAEMLEQDVSCPQCQAQFRLRRQHSLEFRKKKKQERERSERRKVAAWVVAGVIVAILVVSGLAYMILHAPSE